MGCKRVGLDLETKQQQTVRKEGREGGREGEEDRKEGIFPLSGLLGEAAPSPAVRTHRPAGPCGR